MRLATLLDNAHPGIEQPTSPGHSQDVPDASLAGRTTEIHVDQRNLLSVFPVETTRLIAKKGLDPTIRVVFGDTDSQCYLEIDVYPENVPYVAGRLFGLFLMVEGDRFSTTLESGIFASFETITLTGAHLETAQRLLGRVFELVQADPLYFEGLKKELTTLISLDIKGNGEDPSCLKVQSTAHTISLIAKELCPTFGQEGI
jgi:hypothetical protein